MKIEAVTSETLSLVNKIESTFVVQSKLKINLSDDKFSYEILPVSPYEKTYEYDDIDYSAGPKAAAASEVLEDFSIASRQKIRDELEDQIAAFLARGGKIAEVAPNVTADPPKKPTPDYGGRPI